MRQALGQAGQVRPAGDGIRAIPTDFHVPNNMTPGGRGFINLWSTVTFLLSISGNVCIEVTVGLILFDKLILC